jgi:uncharacterized coiled-coil protein SlyX
MMIMTIIFCAAMVLIIAGFLLAFSVLFKQLTVAQNRLLDTLSEKHAAVSATAPAVSEEQAARQIALAAKQMETNLNASLSAIVGAATEKINGKVAAQNQELAQMRDNLLALQKENQKLRSDMTVAKPAPPPVVEPTHKTSPAVASANSAISTPSNATIVASANPAVSKSAISTNVSAVASTHTAPATTGNVTSVSARLPAVATPALVTSKDAPSNTTSAAAMKSDWKGYDGTVFTFPSRDGMDTITWHALTPTGEQ